MSVQARSCWAHSTVPAASDSSAAANEKPWQLGYRTVLFEAMERVEDVRAEAFTSPSFSVSSWINARLETGGSGGEDTTLLLRLSLLSQELSEGISSRMGQVMSGERGGVRQLRAALEETADMRTQIEQRLSARGRERTPAAVTTTTTPTTTVAAAVAATSGQRDYVLDLEALHGAKSRLERARGLLAQVSAWDRLLRETEPAIESGSLTKIRAHVTSLEGCARTLASLPDADIRAIVVKDVKRQVARWLLPALVRGLQRMGGLIELGGDASGGGSSYGGEHGDRGRDGRASTGGSSSTLTSPTHTHQRQHQQQHQQQYGGSSRDSSMPASTTTIGEVYGDLVACGAGDVALRLIAATLAAPLQRAWANALAATGNSPLPTSPPSTDSNKHTYGSHVSSYSSGRDRSGGRDRGKSETGGKEEGEDESALEEGLLGVAMAAEPGSALGTSHTLARQLVPLTASGMSGGGGSSSGGDEWLQGYYTAVNAVLRLMLIQLTPALTISAAATSSGTAASGTVDGVCGEGSSAAAAPLVLACRFLMATVGCGESLHAHGSGMTSPTRTTTTGSDSNFTTSMFSNFTSSSGVVTDAGVAAIAALGHTVSSSTSADAALLLAVDDDNDDTSNDTTAYGGSGLTSPGGGTSLGVPTLRIIQYLFTHGGAPSCEGYRALIDANSSTSSTSSTGGGGRVDTAYLDESLLCAASHMRHAAAACSVALTALATVDATACDAGVDAIDTTTATGVTIGSSSGSEGKDSVDRAATHGVRSAVAVGCSPAFIAAAALVARLYAAPYRWYAAQLTVLLRDSLTQYLHTSHLPLPQPLPTISTPNATLAFTSSTGGTPTAFKDASDEGGSSSSTSTTSSSSMLLSALSKVPTLRPLPPGSHSAPHPPPLLAAVTSLPRVLHTLFGQACGGIQLCDALTACAEGKGVVEGVDEGYVEVAQRLYTLVRQLHEFATECVRQAPPPPAAHVITTATGSATKLTGTGTAAAATSSGGGDWMDAPVPAPTLLGTSGISSGSGTSGGGRLPLLREVVSSAFALLHGVGVLHAAATATATHARLMLAYRATLDTVVDTTTGASSSSVGIGFGNSGAIGGTVGGTVVTGSSGSASSGGGGGGIRDRFTWQAAAVAVPGLQAASTSVGGGGVTVDLAVFTGVDTFRHNAKKHEAWRALVEGQTAGTGGTTAAGTVGTGTSSVSSTALTLSLATPLAPVLPRCVAACASLSLVAHTHALEALLAPIARHLQGVRTLPVWPTTATGTSSSTSTSVGGGSPSAFGGGGEEDDDGLSFSQQPSPYIMATAEYLLALVQHLAPTAQPLMALLHPDAAPPLTLTRLPCALASPPPSTTTAAAVSAAASSSAATVATGGGGVAAGVHSMLPPPRLPVCVPVCVLGLGLPLEWIVGGVCAASFAALAKLGEKELVAAYSIAGKAPPPPQSLALALGLESSLVLPGTGGGSSIGGGGGELASEVSCRFLSPLMHAPLRTLAACASAPECSEVKQREWLAMQLGIPTSTTHTSVSLNYGASETSVQTSGRAQLLEGQANGGGEGAGGIASVATAVSTLWLHAVVKGATALLITEYLKIARLGAGGARQLRTDYEYFAQVPSSFGVDVDPLLVSLIDLATGTHGELSKAADGLVTASGANASAQLIKQVARMRGVMVSLS